MYLYIPDSYVYICVCEYVAKKCADIYRSVKDASSCQDTEVIMFHNRTTTVEGSVTFTE